MKALIDGVWHADIADTPALRAERARVKERWFRDRVSPDSTATFPAAPGRYHLYVSYACPWAHRTILYRELKGLKDVVPMSVVHPRWGGPDGWVFTPDPAFPEVTRDTVNGADTLWQIYLESKPDFTGKVTVPVLWDTQSGQIVNNESQEIMRMLNSAFDQWAAVDADFYPADLRDEIDRINGDTRDSVTMGVYKAGFASSQAAYDAAVADLFATLDDLECRLRRQPYLVGHRITEADWHLFCCLVRFDAVYHGALKCNLKRLIDYPNLFKYLTRLLALPGVAGTVKLNHAQRHYYDDLGLIDPTIVPRGPLSPLPPVPA